MQVYYQVVNHGDGSYGLQFFDSEEAIYLMQDADPETYTAESDGILRLAGDALEDVRTLEQVKAYLALDDDEKWEFEW